MGETPLGLPAKTLVLFYHKKILIASTTPPFDGFYLSCAFLRKSYNEGVEIKMDGRKAVDLAGSFVF